jgi:ATP-binding cassette subfamily C (CFTR/MRP) protein 1
MNATIRDNIVMQKPYVEERYLRVLELCELNDDLKTFPAGERTEIGSRGLNLSGGQKQRVCIARAVYADADIYIIDDCLSALDPHVGKNIFFNVIMQELAKKTRIFVTHGMHFLQHIPKSNI